MEISQELKDKLKTQRLNQYKQQIYNLKMDKTALLAIGDQDGADSTDKRIEDLQKAYSAVEAM